MKIVDGEPNVNTKELFDNYFTLFRYKLFYIIVLAIVGTN